VSLHRGISRFLNAAVASVLVLASSAALAQYQETKLVTNGPAVTPKIQTDPVLVNAWGLTFGPGKPFWVSDNGSGMASLYDGTGAKQALQVAIPAANSPDPSKGGRPTGVVFNGSQEFKVRGAAAESPALFLFAGLDGTITGWNPTVDPTHALIGADNSKEGAVYTGLAISNNLASAAQFLYAADSHNNRVDVYDGTFQIVRTLTDPDLPHTFSVFGVENINGKIYVSFSSSATATGGVIDVFSQSGELLRRFRSNAMNNPWGMALAPNNFGPFSGALLVGNNTPGGTIHAFDLKTGKLLGVVKDSKGQPVMIDELWALRFGGGTAANGDTNQLFFTAGPREYQNGLFGKIEFTGKK
jgi:uncharacterized protein (TIGR03118 family)